MLDYNLLGSRIRALRQQKGLTQSAFAQGLGVSFQAVSNWERGVTPPDLENLVGIASFFGILVDDLLRQNNAPLYLGIDGGGTKTAFLLCDKDGKAIGEATLGPCNPVDVGLTNALKTLERGIETVIAFGETIEIHEGMVHLTIEYRKSVREVRLKHSYMLMLGKHNGVLIDPNGFTKGSFEEFKGFLREKRPDLTIPE
jgi:transcriptional regulator with XRE-family HTH domain